MLSFENGGRLLLEDLITVEAMGHPPVFELGERDLLASVIGVLALAQGGGATLDQLIAMSSEVMVVCGDRFCAALGALMLDGTLPQTIFRDCGPL